MPRPPKTKTIKTIVNTKDYQILTSIARLHNHRIWEELAIAIKQYISKYKLYDATAMTTALEDTTTFIKDVREKTEADVKEEEIKRKIKIWVETFNISPMDTTMNTFEQCKKFIEGVLKRELTPGEIDITMFDEVQQERRENNGEANTFNATR